MTETLPHGTKCQCSCTARAVRLQRPHCHFTYNSTHTHCASCLPCVIRFKFGIPTVTHSRWYEADNDYVTGIAPGLSNTTALNWTISGGVAVSLDQRFFEHIYSRAKQGLSMATYEQDFLAKAYESCATLQQQPGLAAAWLTAMADAAETQNVTVQYCMALPRHILQSAAYPRVTHARASHDYGQSQLK